MTLHVEVTLTQTQLCIQFTTHSGQMLIQRQAGERPKTEAAVVLSLEADVLTGIYLANENEAAAVLAKAETTIWLTPPAAVLAPQLGASLRQLAMIHDQRDVQVTPMFEETKPDAQALQFAEEAWEILTAFGYLKAPHKPKKAGKTKHRWEKALSAQPLFVTYQGSQATVFWQKRNELRIQAGATLRMTTPLNKDGSIGFAVKMGEKLRADHASAIQNGKTTQDIVLKSVNEVGLFLYYGGTNSWLVLADENGKTIDEWTRIE